MLRVCIIRLAHVCIMHVFITAENILSYTGETGELNFSADVLVCVCIHWTMNSNLYVLLINTKEGVLILT